MHIHGLKLYILKSRIKICSTKKKYFQIRIKENVGQYSFFFTFKRKERKLKRHSNLYVILNPQQSLSHIFIIISMFHNQPARTSRAEGRKNESSSNYLLTGI